MPICDTSFISEQIFSIRDGFKVTKLGDSISNHWATNRDANGRKNKAFQFVPYHVINKSMCWFWEKEESTHSNKTEQNQTESEKRVGWNGYFLQFTWFFALQSYKCFGFRPSEIPLWLLLSLVMLSLSRREISISIKLIKLKLRIK